MGRECEGLVRVGRQVGKKNARPPLAPTQRRKSKNKTDLRREQEAERAKDDAAQDETGHEAAAVAAFSAGEVGWAGREGRGV